MLVCYHWAFTLQGSEALVVKKKKKNCSLCIHSITLLEMQISDLEFLDLESLLDDSDRLRLIKMEKR